MCVIYLYSTTWCTTKHFNHPQPHTLLYTGSNDWLTDLLPECLTKCYLKAVNRLIDVIWYTDIYVQNIKIIRNNCDMITFLLLRFSLECIHIIFKDTFFYLTLNFNCRKLLFFWLIFFIYIIFSFAWNSMLFNIVKYSFIDYMFYHM